MPRRWLLKTEPSTYSYADLAKQGRTTWDGIGNATALIHLRAMAPGDAVLIYHTGKEKAVVGLASVAGAPRPDPAASDPRRVVVDLKPVRALKRAVPLAALKQDPALREWELLRISRLSVMPVPAAAWEAIERLENS